MRTQRTTRERGQALALLALLMAAILAGAAVVIDGGNAMAQQRITQNATDSAALAGAVIIAEKMGGATRADSDVVSAMQNAFTINSTQMDTSYYIDYSRVIVGTVGRSGGIPESAVGIEAAGQLTFSTFLAAVAGIPTLTAGAQAIAIAGSLRGICSAADGCGAIPVTFSIPITTCDGSGRPLRIGVEWPIVGLDVAMADQGVGKYESIVPLCKNGPGGVGWLDYGCGGTLNDEITAPCNTSFDIPTWLHSSSGNSNNVDSAVNSYDGQLILVPMFDSTCRDVPSTGLPADCTDPGSGTNLYYHIPRFAIFMLDHAYISGDNSVVCNSPPGTPPDAGNGSNSCFKGWFIRYVRQGRVGQVQNCTDEDNPDTCAVEPTLGVQLIH
jgi:hypothetical protein